VNTQRVSEVETDKEMSAIMKEYDVANLEEDERSPPKLKFAHEYRKYISNKSTQSPTIRRTLPSPPSSSSPPLSSLMRWTSPVSASGLCQSRHRL